MSKIVGVKFKQSGKTYSFAPGDFKMKVGDGVIVETARGAEFGTVASEPHDVPESEIVAPLKSVIRLATEKDYAIVKKHENARPEAIRICEEKVQKHGLDMKLVDAEYTFDGKKLIFTFTSEGRVDFRELVRDLASVFRMRIELRQIGIRDEAKHLGGIAPCGRPCCCANHLTDFTKVSIKMAKTQGLSLNPTKISGLCGRLMCCLAYENEHYAETSKLMPKMGSTVKTPDGDGVVTNNDMLRKRVKVRIENKDGGFELKDFELDDIRFGKQAKEEQPAEKSENEEDLKKLLD